MCNKGKLYFRFWENRGIYPAAWTKIGLMCIQQFSAQNTFTGKEEIFKTDKHLFHLALQPQLQACISAAGLGVVDHSRNSILPADNDQDLLCPGDGGIEDGPVQ